MLNPCIIWYHRISPQLKSASSTWSTTSACLGSLRQPLLCSTRQWMRTSPSCKEMLACWREIQVCFIQYWLYKCQDKTWICSYLDLISPFTQSWKQCTLTKYIRWNLKHGKCISKQINPGHWPRESYSQHVCQQLTHDTLHTKHVHSTCRLMEQFTMYKKCKQNTHESMLQWFYNLYSFEFHET